MICIHSFDDTLIERLQWTLEIVSYYGKWKKHAHWKL
jgi:hypothetical protein